MPNFAPSKKISALYGSKIYFIIILVSFFVAAFVFSLLINSLFLRFSKNFGIRSNPDNMIRWSNSHKPAFGGISFYIVLLISLAASSFVLQTNEQFHNVGFLGFVIAGTIAFLMGLFDDAFNTKVWLKLTAQIACGIILIATGTSIELFPYAWANYLITLIWVIGMMNSLNMLDNMDGISSLVSLFILVAFMIMLLVERNLGSPLTIILAGLIASILGFLFYNWHPSRMYMGDTGSQFLGFILAFMGIVFLWNMQVDGVMQPALKRVLMVAVLFVLPLSDTITVVYKRLRRKSSPFVGGKDHTTHHLSYHGLSDRQVALVFLLVAVIACALTVFAMLMTDWCWCYNIIMGAFFLAVFSALFVIGNRKTPNKPETKQ